MYIPWLLMSRGSAQSGNPVRLLAREDQEAVLGHRRVDRRALRFPIRQQLVQRARVDDRAGKDVRARLRSLLDHADGDFFACARRELLEANRRGEPRRPRSDDDNVEFHGFALHAGYPFGGRCARLARKAELYNALR